MSFDPRQQTHPASITTSNFQLCMLLYLLNHFHDYLFMAWNGHFFSFVMICFNVGLILFFRLFTYLVNSTVLTYFYLWEWLQWIYNILICYVPLFPHFWASLVWKNSCCFFFAVVVVFKYAGVPYFSFSIFGTMQLLLFGVIVNNLI